MKTGIALLWLAVAVPAFCQYAGPAILSRGEAPTGLVAPEVRFSPYVAVSAVWDSGLANVSVNSNGSLATSHSAGGSLAWGVNGTHSWRRTLLGLTYNGSIDHYFGNSSYDSINQNLLLGITHQLSRRSQFSVRSAAGIYNRLTTPIGLSQTTPFDPVSTYVPTTDYFDNRTIYVSGSGDWSYRQTARLSFDFGANGAIVRRRSDALYGTVGYGAYADVQYRTGPHSSLGGRYSFFHYEFTRVFGGSDVQQIVATYSLRITPRTEFGGYAGGAVIESKFESQVPLDPAIAAILGISSATYVSYSRNWQPAFSARLSRVFAKGVAYVAAVHEITPGNGLFLTSVNEGITGGYNYGGTWKHWSIGTYSSYNKARSLGGVRATYSTAGVGLSLSRKLFRYTQYVMGFGIRYYDSSDYSAYNRWFYSVHAGLAFSPGEVPVRLW